MASRSMWVGITVSGGVLYFRLLCITPCKRSSHVTKPLEYTFIASRAFILDSTMTNMIIASLAALAMAWRSWRHRYGEKTTRLHEHLTFRSSTRRISLRPSHRMQANTDGHSVHVRNWSWLMLYPLLVPFLKLPSSSWKNPWLPYVSFRDGCEHFQIIWAKLAKALTSAEHLESRPSAFRWSGQWHRHASHIEWKHAVDVWSVRRPQAIHKTVPSGSGWYNQILRALGSDHRCSRRRRVTYAPNINRALNLGKLSHSGH